MSRVLSGVQPTGQLHLGNYLGAIKNWVDMQDEHECLFCIVDLHAITVPQNPNILRESTRKTAAAYIACGIDPRKSAIFNQSAIPEHSELAWILSCFTPIGWLNRMTQFKDKAGKDKEKSALGLYSYPVLMAADILLYQATHVPVGDDQKQHLELARDIAAAFNRKMNNDFFPIPEPFITGNATRVMSLRDGTEKMSKSDPSENSRIHLGDDADTITKKFKKAKSDAIMGISYDPENRPEAANLLNIFSAISGDSIDSLTTRYQDTGFSALKQDLAEIASNKLAPISTEIQKLEQDHAYLDSILKQGIERAQDLATANMRNIKDIMGFLQS